VKANRQGMSHQPRVFENTAQSNHVSGLYPSSFFLRGPLNLRDSMIKF
jgi:hypothetical protein